MFFHLQVHLLGLCHLQVSVSVTSEPKLKKNVTI